MNPHAAMATPPLAAKDTIVEPPLALELRAEMRAHRLRQRSQFETYLSVARLPLIVIDERLLMGTDRKKIIDTVSSQLTSSHSAGYVRLFFRLLLLC